MLSLLCRRVFGELSSHRLVKQTATQLRPSWLWPQLPRTLGHNLLCVDVHLCSEPAATTPPQHKSLAVRRSMVCQYGVDKGDILWYSRMRKNTRGWDTKADTNGFFVAASHRRSSIIGSGAVDQEQQRTALKPQAILQDTFSNFANFLVGPRGLGELCLSPSA